MKPALDANHRNELVKLLKQAAYTRDVHQVFNDFLEMSAIAISNTVDYIHKDERESRYLEIIRSYEKREQELFPKMYVHLVFALDEKAKTAGPEDVLGLVFNELGVNSKSKGQVFTPQHIGDFMASISCQDNIKNTVEEKGFVSMCDPCWEASRPLLKHV